MRTFLLTVAAARPAATTNIPGAPELRPGSLLRQLNDVRYGW